MENLTRVLLKEIFSHAEAEDAANLQLTCKRFHTIVSNDEDLWKTWCVKKFPDYFDGHEEELCLPKGCDWKWLARCLINVIDSTISRPQNFSGYGCKINAPRSFYAGSWHEAKYHGFGIRIHKLKKQRQIGTFKNGMLDGYSISLTDEDMYKGEFNSGKKQGFGFHAYPNNRSYEGEWIGNRQNGRGSFIWGTHLNKKDQERYDGEFLNSRRHGYGVYIWPSGDSYKGYWKNGHQHGEGVYYWASGSSFEGMWEEDLKQGYGIFRWANGDTFAGEWINGLPVDIDRATHPRIKEAIDKKICTRNVPGLSTNLGQIYFYCKICQTRACVVCKNSCHSLHETQILWSSLNNCGCYCKIPQCE